MEREGQLGPPPPVARRPRWPYGGPLSRATRKSTYARRRSVPRVTYTASSPG